MTSREAFEAWADTRDATHAGKLRSEAAGFDYPLGRLLDECWQAAIQHATEVAVKVCEVTGATVFHDRRSAYDDGCRDCADAIKEALK